MLIHASGAFARYYISALTGCCPLNFYTPYKPLYSQSDLGRRAASISALPLITSSFIYFATRSQSSLDR